MRRLVAILLWSAISAAFIGPGTVTTAARAGASFGPRLLWALTFSTLACLALQEASARLTIATGRPLGDLLRRRLARAPAVAWLVPAAVVLGCAAYEMGNILGAVAGAGLVLDLPPRALAAAVGVVAAAILAAGTARAVARALGVVVALMGIAFLACAALLRPDAAALLRGAVVPAIPAGAGTLALGLVGTTVVPYNLFLGSGLARGADLGEARLGLAIAIPLGGVISMGVLVTGTAVGGDFSFAAVADALAGRLGGFARPFFAWGLFAAGLSSAVTAPLAAALTVRGFLDAGDDPRWRPAGSLYRATWGGVLAFGLAWGLAGVAPIPAIVAAQALNGVILPLVASVLWLCVNDRALVGAGTLAGAGGNAALGASVLLTFLLGTSGVLRAAARTAGAAPPGEGRLLAVAAILAAVAAVPLVRLLARSRRGGTGAGTASGAEP